VISTTAVRCRRCTACNTLTICACVTTSSAVVGSSATISRGSPEKAIAISTRWHWPPESSCE